MPAEQMNSMLSLYGIQEFPPPHPSPELIRISTRDIIEIGPLGLTVVDEVGTTLSIDFGEECLGESCRKCVEECPEEAAWIGEVDGKPRLMFRSDLCDGTACRRCEAECPGELRFGRLEMAGEMRVGRLDPVGD
jgi:methylamine methyltransferase corrinoid activation protein